MIAAWSATRCALTVLGVLVMCVCVGCGESKHQTGASASLSLSASQAGVLVERRADKPAQVDAPGIQFTTGSMTVVINHHFVTITARDWNTITDASSVAHDIGVTLDPDFHAGLTTRHRFQYLADKLAKYSQTRFVPIGIVSAPVGRTLIEVVALFNPTNDDYRLSGLHVRVSAQPPTTTVATAALYTGAGQGVVIPARDVEFLRLRLPLLHMPPRSTRQGGLSESTSFNYDRLVDCGAHSCSA